MNHACPECGFILENLGQQSCPKCDCMVFEAVRKELYVVDVAHQGQDWLEAQARIQQAINQALLNKFNGLKIIHGYGSQKGHTSYIKTRAVAFLKRYARDHHHRLVPDKFSEGAHILYF